MAPGNYPAARQNARGKKPPRILLCAVCTVSCVLFMGSAAMLAVGYLNPFGTVGLSILGVGAVTYFGTILFLVLSCLSMQRKYPGMQPLSFRVPTRRPGRPPPTTMGNPNISGQMPSMPMTSYRVHNDLPHPLPGFKGGPEKPPRVASATNNLPDKSKQKRNNENQVVPDSSHDFDTVRSESLQDPQGQQDLAVADKTEEAVPPAQMDSKCATDQGNLSAKTNVTTEGESPTDVQQQHLEVDPVLDKKDQQSKGLTTDIHANQERVKISPCPSPKQDRKRNKKTHHVEVPFDDYPSSASSVSSSSKKPDISTDTQTKVHERKPEASHPAAKTSEPPVPADKHGKDRHATEDKAAPSASPSAIAKNIRSKQVESQHDKPCSSHSTEYPTATKVSPKREQKPPPIHQEQVKSHARKGQSPDRAEIHQGSPQTAPHPKSPNTSSLSPNPTRKHVPSGQTFPASPPSDRKSTVQLKHEKTIPETLQSKETAAKRNPSPVNPRKPLNNQKHQDPGSSPRNERKSGSPHRDKRTEMHMQQLSAESSSSSTSSRMPASSPKHGMQHRKEDGSAHVSSSPVGRKDPLQHKHDQTDHSQLAVVASGISNTSPKTRNQERIHHDDSHRVNHLPDTGIKAAASNAGKPGSPVRTHRVKQEQRVTHSQEFLSTGSPPSPRKRSPNVSPKFPRNIRTDELNKRHGNRYEQHSPLSSHSTDVPTSPAVSPLTARKLLRFKKEKAHTDIRGHSSDSDSSSAMGLNRQHETQLHLEKPPRVTETSPAAAKASPPCIKKPQTPHEKDQL